MAVASPILLPARSANCHDNQAKLPKTQGIVHSMIATSPSLFRAWRFWASSAHPREAESDSFLACAAKTKQRFAAARTRPARMRPCTPSLSSTMIVVVSRVLREMLRYPIGFFFLTTPITIPIRTTWFPDRTNFVCFHQI